MKSLNICLSHLQRQASKPFWEPQGRRLRCLPEAAKRSGVHAGEGSIWRCTPTWRWACESESRSVVADSLRPQWLYSAWDSPGQNTGVGSLSFSKRTFATQGWNPGLPHCRQILYQLTHKGSPRILEWVAVPFSSGSSQPRDWTQVSRIAGGFFTSWPTRKAQRWSCQVSIQSRDPYSFHFLQSEILHKFFFFYF